MLPPLASGVRMREGGTAGGRLEEGGSPTQRGLEMNSLYENGPRLVLLGQL